MYRYKGNQIVEIANKIVRISQDFPDKNQKEKNLFSRLKNHTTEKEILDDKEAVDLEKIASELNVVFRSPADSNGKMQLVKLAKEFEMLLKNVPSSTKRLPRSLNEEQFNALVTNLALFSTRLPLSHPVNQEMKRFTFFRIPHGLSNKQFGQLCLAREMRLLFLQATIPSTHCPSPAEYSEIVHILSKMRESKAIQTIDPSIKNGFQFTVIALPI